MRLRLFISLLLTLTCITPVNSAQAGGGCGFSTPRISNDFVKPGDTFDVTTEYVMYDVSLSLYQDPKYIPFVTFSSSIEWLSKSSEFLSATADGAKYKAALQTQVLTGPE